MPIGVIWYLRTTHQGLVRIVPQESDVLWDVIIIIESRVAKALSLNI